MKEVKTPKKPLIYYYGIVLLVLIVFNLVVSPILMEHQVEETDYGTFMSMINEKNIGKVEVEDNQIVFTDKNNEKIYKTGLMNDPISPTVCMSAVPPLPRTLTSRPLRFSASW